MQLGSSGMLLRLSASHHEPSVSARSTATVWWLDRIRIQAAASDQPRDHRVGVPHLAGGQLVPAPDRRRERMAPKSSNRRAHSGSSVGRRGRTASTARSTASEMSRRSSPKSEHDRIRFNYWSALTDATSVKDGKLRLQVLISELEHGGYESAARCLGDDLDALVVHLRYPLRHRERWRSTNLLERSLGEVRRRTKVMGRFPGETKLPLTRLGRARPVLQPRQQRRNVHRRQPPTPLPNQVPASRPRHARRGGHRRINSTNGNLNRERIHSGKETQPNVGSRTWLSPKGGPRITPPLRADRGYGSPIRTSISLWRSGVGVAGV